MRAEHWLYTIPLRLRSLFRKRRVEKELDEELRFHLEKKIEENTARGMAPEEARHSALRAMGGLEQRKEECRDMRRVNYIEDLTNDLRYGLRMLRRTPGFAAAAVLSLALGIGANAAIFNLLNAVLLRSLPVEHPEQLVVFSTTEASRDPDYHFSFRTFQTYRERSHTLARVAATAPLRMNVDADGQTLPTAAGQMVSGDYYLLLGVPATLGRVILPDDDARPGAGAVAVLSYAYWQRQFGRDPRVINKAVRLNGQPFTIIGVSAPEFFGTHVGEAADISVPLSTQPMVNADFGRSLITGDGVDDFWLELIGRRRQGVAEGPAQAEAEGILQALVPDMLERAGFKAKMIGHPHLAFEPGSRGLSQLRRRFSKPLLVLMGFVALVLLISCANVANLLLARAANRRREMAVRISLGAGRARLVRQLLTESLLLALVGGACGFLLAAWSRPALVSFLVGRETQSLGAGFDASVLGFTLAVSMLTGVVFGLVPAFSASHFDSFGTLKESSGGWSVGGRRFRLSGSLVAAQTAISIVLLVGAGLFVRTLINLRHLDLGYDQEHVLALRLEPRGSNQKRANGPHLMQLYGGMLDRLRAAPAVRSVSLAGATPLSNESFIQIGVSVPGYARAANEDTTVRLLQIYPDYFATLEIPLLAGRDLGPSDNDIRVLNDPAAPRVAVVNETMARRFFRSPQEAVGRSFTLDKINMAFQVVGVAQDVRDRALREQVKPQAYATFAQMPTGRGQMTLLVRAVGSPRSLAATIGQYAREMDPAMPLLDVMTLADRADVAMQQERLVASFSTAFGALALLLAAFGLYGVLAYTVARRTQEIGIRMALGAEPSDVLGMVLREGLTLVFAGIAIGIPTALIAARLISGWLFGIGTADPLTIAGATFVLLAAAALAGYLPARRASRVDPMVALRYE